MEYPLQLSFKVLALASQIFIRDSQGHTIGYVKQKMFKLKERVEVFTDKDRATKLCEIGADRILDFSANYSFTDPGGNEFGAIRRKGMRSLWKASYEITDGDAGNLLYSLNEESAWVKVMDGLVGQIPIIGAFTGYFFNPTYLVTDPAGTPILRVKKQPAFWEGKFNVEKLAPIEEQNELRILMGTMMMLLLERSRG